MSSRWSLTVYCAGGAGRHHEHRERPIVTLVDNRSGDPRPFDVAATMGVLTTLRRNALGRELTDSETADLAAHAARAVDVATRGERVTARGNRRRRTSRGDVRIVEVKGAVTDTSGGPLILTCGPAPALEVRLAWPTVDRLLDATRHAKVPRVPLRALHLLGSSSS